MHWLKQKLVHDWLNLEPDELRPVGICFAISFTWGFSQMLSWTAASTLFLQYYDASELPIISIASAVLIPLSGLVFLKLNRVLPFKHQFLLFALLFVLAPLGFRMLLAGEAGRWPSLAFAVWYYLEIAFAALLTDAFVTRMFTLRQTRRVFGPISTGSDMAGVPAGLLVGVIVGKFGVANLLLFSACISAIVLVLFSWAMVQFRTRIESGDTQPEQDPDEYTGPKVTLGTLLRNPLVLCILGIEALAEFNLEFLNNAFYAQTELYLGDPEKMATFLGTFFAIASVLSALVQMAASSRLIRALGIGGCLVLGPSLLVLTLGAFVASSLFGAPAGFVFACMAGAKFVQYTVMINVSDVAQFTLVRSLPPALQDRTLALSGTVLAPVLGGLSGLTLLGMIHLFDATSQTIGGTCIVILVLIILLARRAARAYRENLQRMLDDRALTGIEVPLTDAETLETLGTLMQSPDAQTALGSIEMFARRPAAEMRPALLGALRHPDARVRGRAAHLLQQLALPEDAPLLADIAAGEPDGATLADLLPAYARAAGTEGADLLQRHLEHDDPAARQGALVGLLRHGGRRGEEAAARMLHMLAAASDPSRRRVVAAVLDRVGTTAQDELLLALLSDPDRTVRRAAILAARNVRNPLLGPAVLENLAEPELRADVVETLVQGADVMLPAIDALYLRAHDRQDLRATILRIFGRIRGASSVRLLEQHLDEADPDLLREAVTALARCNYRPDGDAGRERVERVITRQADAATWLLRCIAELGGRGPGTLLERALRRELHRRQDLLFRLLGFLYPADAMGFIRFACLYSRSEDRISSAVELLDSTLQGGPHHALLPLFEDAAPGRRLAQLERVFPTGNPGRAGCIEGLLSGRHDCGGRWLSAAALHLLREDAALAAQLPGVGGRGDLAPARAWVQAAEAGGAPGLSVVDRVIVLRNASIFAAVPDEVLSEYADELVEHTVPAGTFILRAGDSGSTLCVVAAGCVHVRRGATTLAVLGAGQVFGELSALSPEVRSADVVAAEDTRLLEITAAAMEHMIAGRGEAAEGIIRVLCQRIQTTLRERTFGDTGSFTVAARADADDATQPTARMLLDVEKALLLKKAEIFASLSDPILLHLARLASEQWYGAGEALFRKGDLGTAMFVIGQGELVVHDDERLVATLRAGEIVGELGLLTSELRSSSVTANMPARVLKVTQGALAELMWDHPQVNRSLIRVLVTRLRRMMTVTGVPAAATEGNP